MPFSLPNLCVSCIHLNIKEGHDDKPYTCNSYPDGIPGPIWNGVVSHFDPVDQEQFTYELKPGAESGLDAYLSYWFDLDEDVE